MNKFLFIAASAMLVLASCTNDESAPEQIEVGFNALTKKSSKSIITATTFTQGSDKFNVWGFYDQAATGTNAVNLTAATASNFMSNVTVEYVTNTWRNATNHYYWPLEGKVGFYGIYPSSYSPASVTWDGITISDYTISSANSSGTNAVDLMYAYAESGRIGTELAMTFYHALSQVSFLFKTNADYPGATIKVNSVTLNDIDLSGDFSFKQPSTTGWTDNEAQTADFIYYGTQSGAITSGTAQQYGLNTLMIPQNIGVNQKATINFTISQENSTDITYSLPIQLTTTTNKWEIKTGYVYTINFKLNEILFNPSVDSWASVDVSPINLYD